MKFRRRVTDYPPLLTGLPWDCHIQLDQKILANFFSCKKQWPICLDQEYTREKILTPSGGAWGRPEPRKTSKLPFFGEVSRKSQRTDFFSFCTIQSQLTYIFCWDHKKRTEIQQKRYPGRQSQGIFRLGFFKFLPYFLTMF